MKITIIRKIRIITTKLEICNVEHDKFQYWDKDARCIASLITATTMEIDEPFRLATKTESELAHRLAEVQE